MCGIAGVLRFDGGPVASATLQNMADALRHRGPDADGCYQENASAPGIALVHRRLSVIDLSDVADQPMPNEDGVVQVLFNGEIYNFRDLRRELTERHTFRSQGDTEVIAHGYEERGEAIFSALDGMFAIAIWDARTRRLVLARDAFGKKPLYYWHDEKRFVFGSEIKALLAAGVPAAMDESPLGEYLALGYVPTPRTFFRGIRKVPPASSLVVDSHGVHEPKAYWDLRFPAAGTAPKISPHEAATRVRELLTSAVQKRLIADVPLGILLSGGIDSSAITAIAARLVPGRIRTFTVGFEGDAFYDERAHAEQVARHIGTEHHADVVRPQAADLIETLLHHHDEPFGDSSALPTYLVAQAARRHVTVVLNGDGGDETFAGYDRFRAVLLSERLPLPARQLLRGIAPLLPWGSQHHAWARRLRRFADNAALPVDERIFGWTSFLDVGTIRTLGGEALANGDRLLSSYREALAHCRDAAVLSQLLYLNARTYLLDDLLPKVDRMTMAWGLEARSPLLDRPLMEYVATLPDALKIQGKQGKIVFRKAVEDLLPPAILERPKHGFGVPLGAWFRTDLRPMMEDVLLSSPRVGKWLRVDALRGLAQQHMSGRADRGQQLWTLLTLELWLRKHGFGA
jgi:asparagine synthase (glutamine-hydrolysing)